jgi:hypothetical protein
MNYDLVEVVIDKVVRTFKLRDWSYDIESIVEDISEALKLIGASKVYLSTTATIVVEGKIAKLPRDCEHVKSLVPESLYFVERGSYLEVNAPDGTELTLSYQALPVDERGYPLVPDNVAVREAVMWYIAKILILQGELKRISFPMAEAEWQWRCGSARAELNVINTQQANKIYNDFVRLNPNKDSHKTNYVAAGKGPTLDRDGARLNNNF